MDRISECKYRIQKSGKMNVDGVVYVNHKLLELLKDDESINQVKNVATLPGIVKASIAMSDIHSGYGFPIGGVAGFDIDKGIVSPGGVGYDINCGVRLLKTNLLLDEAKDSLEILINILFQTVPAGVGSENKNLKLSQKDLGRVLEQGASWAIKNGFGCSSDLDFIEDNGTFKNSNPDIISKTAKDRGINQLGTLGSGNHFLEIGFVDEIYDEDIANQFGLFKNQLTIFIHTGSRGLGHQVCDDYLSIMDSAGRKYGITIPDSHLACAPIKSDEGVNYLKAMSASANFAYANRQIITHYIREAFERVFNNSWENLSIHPLYDVCHNIAKFEEHLIDGKMKKILVHRKGATRAFPAGHKDIPEIYQSTGQPVLIPGDMGRCSFVLVGTKKAMDETFGSSCHGAGRVMSRHQAKKFARGRNIIDELYQKGIIIKGASRATISEEMPEAYKDVSEVVETMVGAGLSNKIAKLKPLAVIKG